MVLQYSRVDEIDVKELVPTYKKVPVSFANNVGYEVDISIYDATEVSMMQNMLFYKADITGLKAGTKYKYRIGDKEKNEWSERVILKFYG